MKAGVNYDKEIIKPLDKIEVRLEQIIKPKHYKYPNPDDITINEADLKLHLQDFSEANKNQISWKDILILIPAWAVLFTAEFKSVWSISGSTLKGYYTAFLFLGTLSYFSKFWWYIRYFLLWCGKKVKLLFYKEEKNKEIKFTDYCKKYNHIAIPADKVEAIKTIINFKNRIDLQDKSY